MIQELTTNVIAVLEDGPFADVGAFSSWYEQSGLGDLSGLLEDDIEDMLDRWIEECFCDLFGLAVLGPSFFAANCALLSAIDPQGLSPGDDHPPNVVRFDLLMKAVTYLDWSEPEAFWKAITESFPHIPQWARFLTPLQIERAISALQRALTPLETALYQSTDTEELEQLAASIARAVPPTNVSLEATGDVSLRLLDFRATLFAGWLCWYRRDNPNLTFLEINQLCDQAILQQHAVDLWISRQNDKA